MKILTVSFYFFIFLGLLHSCHPKPSKQVSLKTISVDVDKRAATINFSDLFSKVELIPLETSDECLIGEVTKIIFHNDCFYIADQVAKCIYVFGRDGKFISKLGAVGRGPGEFLDLVNLFIDKAKNQLIVDADHKYQIYDLATNRLIKEKSYILDGYEKMYLGDESFASYLENLTYNSRTKNIVIERKGDILDSYIPIPSFLAGFPGVVEQVFSENEQGDHFLSMPLSDTIYTVTKDEVLPYCLVDFGEKSLPASYLSNAPEKDKLGYILACPYFKCVYNFIENENYIHFTVFGDDRILYNYFYLKNGQKDYLYASIVMDEKGFAPMGLDNACYGDNFLVAALPMDQAYSYQKTIEAIHRIKDNTDYWNRWREIAQSPTSKEFVQIMNGLDEDSNPILTMIHLK